MEQYDPRIFLEIPGGPEVVDWYGSVPSFHDAEIVSLDLQARHITTLKIRTWGGVMPGQPDLIDYRIVTFLLHDVIDLQLEGFSPQNVINCLEIRRSPIRPDRSGYYSSAPDDIEITLEPCYGLFGTIRCRSLSMYQELAS